MAFGSRAGEFDDEDRLIPRTYDLPDLPWETIVGRLEQITIASSGSTPDWRPPAWLPAGSHAAT